MKDFRKNVKMPEDVKWLIPGLQVKRWFMLIFLGAAMMTLGVLILIDIKPIFYTMEFIRKIALHASTEWLAFSVLMFGAALFFKGCRNGRPSITAYSGRHISFQHRLR